MFKKIKEDFFCPVCNEQIGEDEENLAFVFRDSFMEGGEAYFDLDKEERYHESCFKKLI